MAEHIDYDKESEARYAAVNKTGGPAAGGLTVRDYFAAKAMQGLVCRKDPDDHELTEGDIAEIAYYYADAMMELREWEQ